MNLVGEQLLVVDSPGTSFKFVSTLTYDTSGPSTTITGLQGGESVESVDFRPSNGALYGFTNQYRLYQIDTSSGAATVVGSALALTGAIADIDFNPVADRLRVVTTSGISVRVNPDTGALAATDTSVAFAAADPNFGNGLNCAGLAYTNNYVGATTTTLYAVEAVNDVLATVGGPAGTPSPNSGQVFTVAATTPTLAGSIGMDISGVSGTAYVMAGVSGFIYTLNLSNGNMTSRAPINGNDIAVVP